LPLGLGQPLADTNLTPIGPSVGNNTPSNATIQAMGFNTYVMTIPLSVPVTFMVGEVPVNMMISGTIVAFNEPEPSTFVMAGIAAASLAVWQRRKFVRR